MSVCGERCPGYVGGFRGGCRLAAERVHLIALTPSGLWLHETLAGVRRTRP